MTERYMLFGGYDFYPNGGIEDYKGSFNSLSKVLTYVAKYCTATEWWHVYDTVDEIIKHSWEFEDGR